MSEIDILDEPDELDDVLPDESGKHADWPGIWLDRQVKITGWESLVCATAGSPLSVGGDIDREFMPYLMTLNAYPFIVSTDCCIGHTSVKKFLKPKTGPTEREKQIALASAPSGKMGYLHFICTADFADWLHRGSDLLSRPWLAAALSMLKADGCFIPRYLKDVATPTLWLAVAWDSKQWPQPMDDFCRMAAEYYELIAARGRQLQN